MPKNPLHRDRAIEVLGQFMLLEGMADLDFFVCGSIRRGAEEVGDIDLICVGDFPTTKTASEKYLQSGAKKSRTYYYHRTQINMWKTEPKLLGAAIMYATGSGNFNRYLRQMCIRKGLKLSQNGLVKRDSEEFVAGRTEKEIFNALGLKYIPPKFRVKTRLSSTIQAFKLRSKKDYSHVNWVLGRVFDRSLYSKNQQSMLPPNYKVEDIDKNLAYSLLLLRRDKNA